MVELTRQMQRAGHLLVLLALLLPVASWSDSFGDTDIDGANAAIIENTIPQNPYTAGQKWTSAAHGWTGPNRIQISRRRMPSNGTVTAFRTFYGTSDEPTIAKSERAVIYADSSGVPGALVAVSPVYTTPTGNGWMTLSFSSGVHMAANQYFWIGLWGGTGTNIGETVDSTPNTDWAYALNTFSETGDPLSQFPGMGGDGQWSVVRKIVIIQYSPDVLSATIQAGAAIPRPCSQVIHVSGTLSTQGTIVSLSAGIAPSVAISAATSISLAANLQAPVALTVNAEWQMMADILAGVSQIPAGCTNTVLSSGATIYAGLMVSGAMNPLSSNIFSGAAVTANTGNPTSMTAYLYPGAGISRACGSTSISAGSQVSAVFTGQPIPLYGGITATAAVGGSAGTGSQFAAALSPGAYVGICHDINGVLVCGPAVASSMNITQVVAIRPGVNVGATLSWRTSLSSNISAGTVLFVVPGQAISITAALTPSAVVNGKIGIAADLSAPVAVAGSLSQQQLMGADLVQGATVDVAVTQLSSIAADFAPSVAVDVAAIRGLVSSGITSASSVAGNLIPAVSLVSSISAHVSLAAAHANYTTLASGIAGQAQIQATIRGVLPLSAGLATSATVSATVIQTSPLSVSIAASVNVAGSQSPQAPLASSVVASVAIVANNVPITSLVVPIVPSAQLDMGLPSVSSRLGVVLAQGVTVGGAFNVYIPADLIAGAQVTASLDQPVFATILTLNLDVASDPAFNWPIAQGDSELGLVAVKNAGLPVDSSTCSATLTATGISESSATYGTSLGITLTSADTSTSGYYGSRVSVTCPSWPGPRILGGTLQINPRIQSWATPPVPLTPASVSSVTMRLDLDRPTSTYQTVNFQSGSVQTIKLLVAIAGEPVSTGGMSAVFVSGTSGSIVQQAVQGADGASLLMTLTTTNTSQTGIYPFAIVVTHPSWPGPRSVTGGLRIR